MRIQTIWLLGMLGLAIVLLGAAIIVQGQTDAAGKVLAILSIVVGSLVTVGASLFRKGNPDA